MCKCPNCAGNLKFDIARQQLYCEYCGTQANPYSFDKEREKQESGTSSEEYMATVFTCPQCGGEIISEDTTIATFCSFCGDSIILDRRIKKERRPASIVPFTKTKDDCRTAYGKMLRRAIFAPKELKNEALIEKFRGIYMPYWVYSFEKKEPVTFWGKKTYRRGNYLITDHYRLECEIEEDYKRLAYDASSTFSDDLSNAIGPFDLSQGKAFVPSFLSGFYADTSDVEKYVYLQDAEDLVIQDAGQWLLQDPVCRRYHAGQGEQQHIFQNALRPSDRTIELAMLPVWFLSYRNGDRVSYAVVNGQTGKVAADLPVDRKRYLAGSFLLAIPLFFLLNLFFTITPKNILALAALLALLCVVISNVQLSHILTRESGEEDKGLSSIRRGTEMVNTTWKRKRPVWKPWESSMGMVMIIMLVFYASALLPGFFIHVLEGRVNSQIALLVSGILIFSVINLLYSVLNRSQGRQHLKRKSSAGDHFRKKWPVLRKPLGGIGIALIILLIAPAFDWFYYIGALVCMGTVLWAIMDIIKQHNMLTTRKLPQLNMRGGDR